MTCLLHYDYFENRPHPLAELLRTTICLLGCSTKSNLKCFCKRTVGHPLQDKGDRLIRDLEPSLNENVGSEKLYLFQSACFFF